MRDKQTGLFIKRSFADLGCEVIVVDAKVEPNKMVSMAKKIRPDLLFCSRTPSLLSGMKVIKQQLPQLKTVCWNVDARTTVKAFGDKLLQLFNQVDVLYTVAEGNIEEYKKYCPNTIIKHLQQGCDPRTHNIEKLTTEDHRKYGCDVMFAGSYNSELHIGRIALIDHLKKQSFKFKLYGYNNCIRDIQQSKANLCSKIVLSQNGSPEHSMRSVRDYKVMAAGGFLLATHSIGIENWFKVGKELETYKSKEECVDKIKYYLNHPEERKRIAEAGYEIVHKKHRYIDRISSVLNDLALMKNKK
jgi:hypothetical protein